MRILKSMFYTTVSLIIIGSIAYSLFLAHSMYEKYNETINWNNSSLLSNIHQVPPSLAQNYISTEQQELFSILTDINIALEEMKGGSEVKDNKYSKYWDLHDRAESEIEKSNMYDSLAVQDIFNNFSLYLKADLAIKRAYEELNIESLEEYATIFSSRLSKNDNELERSFLNKLHEISNDYKELNNFSNNAIDQLGIIEDNFLYVDVRVNRELTDELLKQISDKGLTKFTHIQDLVELLNGDTWGTILAHNSSSLEYYSWKESEAILNALLHTNYVPVSFFDTVEDVLDYNRSISLEERENQSIDRDSAVTGVFYDGQQLNDGLYIKRGTSLNFTIDYQYTEDPKSTVTVEYVDVDGNKLSDDEMLEGYVDSSLSVNVKDITDYVFVRIENELNSYPEEDSIIRVIYKEFIPEPEPEESNIGDNEEDDLEDNGDSNDDNDNLDDNPNDNGENSDNNYE